MSVSAIENTELWNNGVKPYVLEQYKDSEKWLSILKGVIDRIQDLDDASVEFQGLLDFMSGNVTGSHLDWVAGLVNIKRMSGEGDSDFLMRIVAVIRNRNSGTPDSVITKASYLSGSAIGAVDLIEEQPGVFLVYTPEGRQIASRDVSRISPVGVCGLPAAALKTASGKFIVDGSRLEWNLTDDDGETLTSDDGDTLTWLEKPARKMLCVARDENIGNTVQKTVMTEDGKIVLTEDGLVLRTDV